MNRAVAWFVLTVILLHVPSVALAQYVQLWNIVASSGPAAAGFDLGDNGAGFPTTHEGSPGGTAARGLSNQGLGLPRVGVHDPSGAGAAIPRNTVYGDTDGDGIVEFVSHNPTPAGGIGSLTVWNGATGTMEATIPLMTLSPTATLLYVVLLDINPGDGLGRAEILVHWADLLSFTCVCPTTACPPGTCFDWGTACYGIMGASAAPAQDLGLGPNLLQQNAPNPFATDTQIAYTIPVTGRAEIHIYDTQGRKVRVLTEGTRVAGTYAAKWNGRDEQGTSVPPGIYFYELVTDRGREESRKSVRIE